MSEIHVVAGGPSLKGFDFNKLKNKECIAINKSILYVPNAKWFITIDYSFLHKIKQNERNELIKSKATKVFVANYGSDHLRDIGGAIKCTKTNKIYDLSLFDIIIRSKHIGGISMEWNKFSTGNCSGYCALQLAVLLKYDNIHLYGIDLKTNSRTTHFHGGYGEHEITLCKKLNRYSNDFFKGIKICKNHGINVISRSKYSPLNKLIPYIPL